MVQLPVASRTAPARAELSLERLAQCVRRLDPATRALLDLSVRRGIPDDRMAPMLRTDPFHLAWRRARALEAVASDFGGTPDVPLADVRAALKELPDELWLLGAAPAALPRSTTDPAAGVALVPVEKPRAGGAIARLDEFAAESPTLRAAFAALGRALARKAVRTVIWRRRA